MHSQKVYNGGELTAPGDAVASITYDLFELSADMKMMTLDISIGGGWWRFVLAKDDPTSTSDIDKELFSFYPNPASNLVQINSTEMIDMILVKDIAGKEVMVKSNTTSNATINVANLHSGLYLLECRSGDKRSVKKLFVQ